MGSVFGQEFLRRQRMERKEEGQTESEGEEGWDDGWDVSCNMFKKKDSFFLPFPPLVFEVTIHSSAVGRLPKKKIPQCTSANLFRLLVPYGKETGRKEGCTLKTGAVVTQERRGGGGDPPVTFLIALYSPQWVMRFTACVSASRGSYKCVFVCAYVYSSPVRGQWFTRRESSRCGALRPIRLFLSAHIRKMFFKGAGI